MSASHPTDQIRVVGCIPAGPARTRSGGGNHHSERPKITYLGDQDTVTGANAHGDTLALAAKGAGADGEDLGLVELLDAGLGQEDAAGGLGLGLDALHQHPVQERDQRLDRADGGGLFFFPVVISLS